MACPRARGKSYGYSIRLECVATLAAHAHARGTSGLFVATQSGVLRRCNKTVALRQTGNNYIALPGIAAISRVRILPPPLNVDVHDVNAWWHARLTVFSKELCCEIGSSQPLRTNPTKWRRLLLFSSRSQAPFAGLGMSSASDDQLKHCRPATELSRWCISGCACPSR